MNGLRTFSTLFLFILPLVTTSPQNVVKRSPKINLCENNESGFKCNDFGYFDPVQCDGDGCFCVTPHTSIPAYDTRTSNAKTLPKCGACIKHITNMLVDGDLPSKTFFPKCDTALGDFERLQCDGIKRQCFCVDEKTGKEQTGTRVPFEENQKTKCGKLEITIQLSDYPIFEKVKKIPFIGTNPPCAQTHSRGTSLNCKNSTELRYFFHTPTYQCLAFQYDGCGGNENNFKTEGECYSACALQDWFQCSGHQAIEANGQPYLCPVQPSPPFPPGFIPKEKKISAKLDDMGCPKGYQCNFGAFMGICCNTSQQKRNQNNYILKCSNGAKPWSNNPSNADPVKGISCKDGFCPKNTKCEENSLFAFCCPNK